MPFVGKGRCLEFRCCSLGNIGKELNSAVFMKWGHVSVPGRKLRNKLSAFLELPFGSIGQCWERDCELLAVSVDQSLFSSLVVLSPGPVYVCIFLTEWTYIHYVCMCLSLLMCVVTHI